MPAAVAVAATVTALVVYDKRINVAAEYVRLFVNGKVCREILGMQRNRPF